MHLDFVSAAAVTEAAYRPQAQRVRLGAMLSPNGLVAPAEAFPGLDTTGVPSLAAVRVKLPVASLLAGRYGPLVSPNFQPDASRSRARSERRQYCDRDPATRRSRGRVTCAARGRVIGPRQHVLSILTTRCGYRLTPLIGFVAQPARSTGRGDVLVDGGFDQFLDRQPLERFAIGGAGDRRYEAGDEIS